MVQRTITTARIISTVINNLGIPLMCEKEKNGKNLLSTGNQAIG
jgi:hypothetical protein